MFISKLVLHRCERFYLKGIETLEINPTLKTQIILGTNGSGKSSLLKVGFTVLPADKNDFKTGGYKLIHVLHNGRQYELKNDFATKTPSHSFICDGEELNEGHTAAVQRELVREHFNMTMDLHKVLTGQLNFTDMNTIQRREWITLLSSANFDYVIQLYNRIRKGVRDTGAVIKHLSSRLVNETAKKIDDETFNALRRQSQETSEKLIRLHQHSKREGVADTFEVYSREYHDLLSELDGLLQQARYLKGEVPASVLEAEANEVAVNALRDSLRSRVQMLEAALQEVSDRHSEIDKQLHEVNELEDIDPVELEKQITALLRARDDTEALFRITEERSHIPAHSYCFATVKDLMELLHEVTVNDESFLDRKVYASKQTQGQELQQLLIKGQSRIGELEYRLSHIRSCSAITCPRCSHSFKEGVSGNEEEEIRLELDKGYAFKRNLEEKLNAIKEWMEQASSLNDSLYQLQQLRDRNPDLNHLWTVLNQQGGFSRGRALIPVCNDFIHDVKINMQLLDLDKELQPLLERRSALQKIDQSSQLREVASSLAERVLDLKSHLMDARETLKEVDAFARRLVEARSISQAVETALQRLDNLMTQMCRFMAVEEVQAQVKRHQVQLGMLEQSLAEAEVQMGIIHDLNRSLEEARAEEKALIALEKLLSPRDGIIAEQILVFINDFIESINEVIAKVWGYNLALDVCNLEEGELNYKFPIYIHNAENLIPDIEFGSDSQKDIINQAFRLVVYKFLDLQGFPLYLDELGRTFDEVHRLNLTLALKDLMGDETYSQVFFISHSFESQNSYPNSQIAVIDDSHVSLSRIYNEHVSIS